MNGGRKARRARSQPGDELAHHLGPLVVEVVPRPVDDANFEIRQAGVSLRQAIRMKASLAPNRSHRDLDATPEREDLVEPERLRGGRAVHGIEAPGDAAEGVRLGKAARQLPRVVRRESRVQSHQAVRRLLGRVHARSVPRPNVDVAHPVRHQSAQPGAQPLGGVVGRVARRPHALEQEQPPKPTGVQRRQGQGEGAAHGVTDQPQIGREPGQHPLQIVEVVVEVVVPAGSDPPGRAVAPGVGSVDRHVGRGVGRAGERAAVVQEAVQRQDGGALVAPEAVHRDGEASVLNEERGRRHRRSLDARPAA